MDQYMRQKKCIPVQTTRYVAQRKNSCTGGTVCLVVVVVMVVAIQHTYPYRIMHTIFIRICLYMSVYM